MHERKNILISLSILGGLVFLALVPLFLMFSMSLRRTVEIYTNFWAFPFPAYWGNFGSALSTLVRPTLNSLFVGFTSVLGILVLSILSGYAFARLRFLGKELLFGLILILMMVPGMLLLTPNYILAVKLGLRDSYWGLWLFYVSGGQIVGIFLMRSFFQSLPEELFESARIDGATELRCIWHIAIPLARPIMVTVAITTILGLYSDIIWPMLIINDHSKETLMQALVRFSPASQESTKLTDLGVVAAGYVFATIPIMIIFWFGMKAYMQGILSGAVKQ